MTATMLVNGNDGDAAAAAAADDDDNDDDDDDDGDDDATMNHIKLLYLCFTCWLA